MGITFIEVPALSGPVIDDDIEELNSLSVDFYQIHSEELVFRNYVEGIPPEGFPTLVRISFGPPHATVPLKV